MVSLNLKRCGVASASSPATIFEFHQQRGNLGWLTCEARYDRGKLPILSLLQSNPQALRFCGHIGRSAFADFEIDSATIAQHRSLQRRSIKQSHFQSLHFTACCFNPNPTRKRGILWDCTSHIQGIPTNPSLRIRHAFRIRIGHYHRHNDSSTERCNRADER
jgi:hypothetical protein